MSDTFTIRLQFPDGRADLVSVTPATTVQQLHDDHVAAYVTEGLRGQLIYMGRPLAPPLSTLASHRIVTDSVVQIFIRRPGAANADEPHEETAPTANPHVLPSIFGLALFSAWIYLFMDMQETQEEYEDYHMVTLICLVFLSGLFVASGGVRQLLSFLH